MIGVQVAPSHPLPLGHFEERRMRLEFEFSWLPGEPLNQRQESLPVGLEISGPSATELLVNLRPGWEPGGPICGYVKCAPFDQPAPAKMGIDRNRLLAHRGQEGVVQVADSLARIHPAPAGLKIGTQQGDALHNLLLNERLINRFKCSGLQDSAPSYMLFGRLLRQPNDNIPRIKTATAVLGHIDPLNCRD